MIFLLVLAAAVLALLWWARRRYLVITVRGRSMIPTLNPGDLVLVRRAGAARLRRGQLVVLRSPALPYATDEDRNGLMIKRLAALPGEPPPREVAPGDHAVPAGHLVALGDNPPASLDSRQVGYWKAADVIGVVLRTLTAGRPAAREP
ncbi:S26 family signal peptidase [Bailinhaonella thermotolerans]|uniref:S26 family signal peptidase n=1 Tax=Bailinhaonella thermotolerans TaxID=1070861 RepID=A0A3A4B530_9ACTN|nr:S26 family signal peptidase [Bailinhaonella thermotolerans]RJL33447.1 S26 family signal peptidase [Bailinhaonella thermotolerans]